MHFDLKSYLDDRRRLIENFLAGLFLPEGELKNHRRAMQYSLLAGGKRVRPILCLATIEALGKDFHPYVPIACTLECIHTYSLIHDDLPAMDNDDLRRGKPTNHKVFGEAQAILAGDGLLTLAFDLLSDTELGEELEPRCRLRIIHLIAGAAGSDGMVGGQSLDIAAEGRAVSLEELQTIHRKKTGALITASVQAGALLGGADEQNFSRLTTFGGALGLAFQIKDDLLNVEGTTEELGKAAGSDAERMKATYPGLLGLQTAREKLASAVNTAVDTVENLGPNAEALRSIAHYILTRTR
jgi:geranylgeranyl diphosphate synthase type II